MAKRKILIEFTDNPTLGAAFSYDITIGGIPFLYFNGLTTLNLDYVNGSDIPYISIGRKNTLSETIDATINFLLQYYSSSYITYTRVDNNIEVLLNFENAVVMYPFDANDNILISDDAYSPNINFKLKYLVEWTDSESVLYSVRIYKKGYTGTSIPVSGYGVLKYGSIKQNLEAIRGNGLDLSLDATMDLTLEDLYTEEENSFAVKMYRKNKLLFDGFLKPDGVFQSFVQDQWILNLSCVDGLGLLKDLAFVQSTGLHWTGKQKAIDIIYNCLARTGLQMNLNTSVNIYYEGLTPSDELDPFTQIYLSVDRFIKDDNDTIMDCNEVLSSVLNLFNAVICQIEGEWYIYRPNEIYENPIVKFRKYSETDNTFIKLNTKNLEFNLGSQINNFYPHHSGGNQQIEIKGSVSAARINYKYGYLKSISSNKNLHHIGFNYENWTIIDQSLIILNPLKNDGLLSSPIDGDNANIYPPVPIIQSELINLDLGTILNIRLKANKTSLEEEFYDPFTETFSLKPFVLTFKIIFDATTGTDYTLKKFGNDYSWDNGQNLVQLGMVDVLDYTIPLPPLPGDGNVSIIVYQAEKFGYETYTNYELTMVDFINMSTSNAKTGAIGEFHTVQRQNRPSSISTETTKIYNGDSSTIIYEGAVLKSNNTIPTSVWFRRGKTESKPILQIAGEDKLRLQQKPQKLFTGDVYGFLPYLSVITIDNLEGKFLPIEWSFDAKMNITSIKLLQFFGEELNDIDYKYTLDYGKTVKATITS